MRYPAPQVSILAEACVAIALASSLVRIINLRRLASVRSSRYDGVVSHEVVLRLSWAVEVTASFFGASCLPRALALHWMLGRRRVPTKLRLGTRLTGGRLPAHDWVQV